MAELELSKMKLRKPRYGIQSLESEGRYEKLEILGLDSLRVFGGGCYWHGCRETLKENPAMFESLPTRIKSAPVGFLIFSSVMFPSKPGIGWLSLMVIKLGSSIGSSGTGVSTGSDAGESREIVGVSFVM
jgi:hypothetical protein